MVAGAKASLVWSAIVLLMLCPVVVAAFSPFMAGRDMSYIVGGMAGIVALSILLIQPLLAVGYLPAIRQGNRWHQLIGRALVFCILLHVAALYLASPDDMTDALLLVAPTPFSIYGVVGLWSAILTILLVAVRRRIGLHPAVWRIVHNCLALIVVGASVVHALMIEGTMGAVSKLVLCICILVVSLVVVVHVRIIRLVLRRRLL